MEENIDITENGIKLVPLHCEGYCVRTWKFPLGHLDHMIYTSVEIMSFHFESVRFPSIEPCQWSQDLFSNSHYLPRTLNYFTHEALPMNLHAESNMHEGALHCKHKTYSNPISILHEINFAGNMHIPLYSIVQAVKIVVENQTNSWGSADTNSCLLSPLILFIKRKCILRETFLVIDSALYKCWSLCYMFR